MPESTGLTVGQVAARLGVTVRALHHWDETGLARPSQRSGAGYRLYTAADLERLHRVLVYRELGLGLEAIGEVLDDASADVPGALREQRALVGERIERLRLLGEGLDRMIEAHERGIPLSVEEQSAIFGPGWDPESPAKAKQRYGDNAQWRRFAEQSATRTPEEWRAVTEAMTAFNTELAEAMDTGVTPGSPEANHLADRHREVFAAYFPITRQMQVILARTYDEDPDYTAHYNAIRKGLATWFRQVIDARARTEGINPDNATWE